MILVGDCDHQGSIAPSVTQIEVCASQSKHFDEWEVVSHGCQLHCVVAILRIHHTIYRETIFEQLDYLRHIVGSYGSQHAEAMWVREYCGIFAVPSDLIVVKWRMVQHEGIGGVSRKAGPPLVDVEGQPLRRTEYCIRRSHHLLIYIELQHLIFIIYNHPNHPNHTPRSSCVKMTLRINPYSACSAWRSSKTSCSWRRAADLPSWTCRKFHPAVSPARR